MAARKVTKKPRKSARKVRGRRGTLQIPVDLDLISRMFPNPRTRRVVIMDDGDGCRGRRIDFPLEDGDGRRGGITPFDDGDGTRARITPLDDGDGTRASFINFPLDDGDGTRGAAAPLDDGDGTRGGGKRRGRSGGR